MSQSDAPPKSRASELSPAQRIAESMLKEPERATMDERPKAQYIIHPAARGRTAESVVSRFLRFRRGPWEALATLIIAIGVIMLMQPFAIGLYTYSFVTILTGTVMFIIVSHFPD